MAVSKRVRYEVLRRDNNTCRYCHATDTPLTIDHVIPTALGGTDDPSNLVAACKECNAGKSSAAPDEKLVAQVNEDTLRWADAVRKAAIAMLRGDEALRERLDAIGEYWDNLIPEYRRNQPRFRLPSDWRQVVAGLLAAGLPDSMVLDSMDVGASRANLDNVFRYVIGVANNKLAKLHEDAAALLSAADKTGQPEQDAELGWGNRAWRKGYLCALDHIQRYESGDPTLWESPPISAFQYRSLAMVVDAEGMSWVASA